MGSGHLLLVEDDERIGSSLQRALVGSDFTVEWVRSGRGALRSAAEGGFGLVVLDLGLPDLDGLQVCRELQLAHPDLPVLMLTARDEEMDAVVGLDAGAIDYVTKPFRLAELLARIRAQLRRPPLDPPAAARVVVGDISLDAPARRAWRGGLELDLRPKEFDVLARLLVDAGRVVRREVLMAEVWDENWFGSTKTLDFHIATLRRKLDDGMGTVRISTVRGVGYRFEEP